MLLLSTLAFLIIVFLLISIMIAIAWMAFWKNRVDASEAAKSEIGTESQEIQEDEAGEQRIALGSSALLRTDRFSTINFWDGLLAHFDFGSILKARLEQAELSWSVGRVTSMMLLFAAISFAILTRFLPVWAAVLAATFVGFAPYAVIGQKRNRRLRAFRENFPDVLDSMARALRAGYPLAAAMEMVASESAPPVSTEMRRTSTEANLGRGWPQALESLGQRIPLLEVNMFISAVQLHARTGGKLSDVMTGLAENMRETQALQGEVRALAAHGKLTGLILTILPIGIAIMMLIVSPVYMHALLNHPWGKNLITAAVACLVIAHFVIRKIVEIKV